MPFVQLHSTDVRLHYQVVGGCSDAELDGNKQTILLLHPGLTDIDYFHALCDDALLKARFNLVAFDTPAHGKTTGTVTPEGTLERKARCILEAWDMLGFSKFHCIGEGLCGSTIGLYLAIMRPTLVQSLQLISPMFGYDPESQSQLQLSILESLINAPVKKGRFDAQTMSTLQELYQGQATRAEDRLRWAEKLQERYGTVSEGELRELFNPITNRRPISDSVLEDVACPVLILAGEADNASSPSRAESLGESLCGVPGGASVHIVHNAPHFMTEAFPTIIIRFVRRFLERQS